MAQSLPLIIGIGSLVTSAYSIYQTAEAADEAKEISKRNQQRIEAEAAEQERRERFNLGREKATIRARIAASGIKGVTPATYYTDYVKQRESEIRWLRTSAESRSDIAGKEGDRARRIGYAQAIGQAGSSAMKSYSWFETYV